jgi:hypothetical protein
MKIKIGDYKVCYALHSTNFIQDGSAIIIKENIKYFEFCKTQGEQMQVSVV